MPKNSLKIALATGGLLTGVSAGAQAAVIYTDLTSSPVSGTDVYFNLTTGTAQNSTFSGYQFHVYGTSSGSSKPSVTGSSGNTIVTDGTYALNLPGGATVSSADNFTGTGKMNTNFPADGTKGYLGLSITNGPDTDFGWAQVSLNSNDTASLFGFAYENTAGKSITIPSVPEPSNVPLAILLTGAAAMVVARRRRIEAANRQS